MQSRREFLGRALMAGAGAAVFEPVVGGAVSPDVAQADTGSGPSPRDPGFLAGQVADIGSDGTLTVVDADSQSRQVTVHGNSHVWKHGQTDGPKLAVGDCIYARGTPEPSGGIDLASAWVGIENFDATVVQSGSSSLQAQLQNGSAITINTFDLTQIWSGASASPTYGDASSLNPGTPIQVIGFSDDSSTLVTTATQLLSLDALTGYANDVSADPVETVPVITPDITAPGQCEYKYFRLASWQCCGGVNACGSSANPRCNPPPTGTGACATCRSDLHGTAYPCLSDHGGCTIENCRPNLPSLRCGDYVNLSAVCHKGFISVPINDHGPAVRCIPAFGCKSWHRVCVDLTPCTMTALGGDLAAGFLDVQIAIYLPC